MTPIERAAMAIALVRGKRWAEVSDTDRVLYREDARAVFVSLQEPSEAMVWAGAKSIDLGEDGGFLGGRNSVALDVFVAMLKAALK